MINIFSLLNIIMKLIKKIIKRKCDFCYKKLKLFHLKCKCGGRYCGEHKNSFMHICSLNDNVRCNFLKVER